MTDRELLELAAKAAGMKIHTKNQAERDEMGFGDKGLWIVGGSSGWNPLTYDGDALRLAVKLNIHIRVWVYACEAQYGECESTGLIHASDCGGDLCAATRRAIVLLAAEIGKSMS